MRSWGADFRPRLFVAVSLVLAACTGLNEKLPIDGAAPLDAPFDSPDAIVDGGPGAGGHGGGSAGATPAPVAGAGGGAAGGRGGAAGARAAGGNSSSAAGASGASGGMGGSGAGVGRGGNGAGGIVGSGGSASGGTSSGGAIGTGGVPAGSGGAGGATAACPAGTVSPCVPGSVDVAQDTCCQTGKRTRSRTCNPTTCQYGSYGDWSSCSVQAECTPGTKQACPNNDSCGNVECSDACKWGTCVPKDGAQCLSIAPGSTSQGSNHRCGTGSHAHDAQWCLPPPNYGCVWSDQYKDCENGKYCEC